ncbi:MAG: cytochrome c maturation protein CcmE [bacterium]|nr:cytochrome c maturation protein CcmE [bacterium]
MSKGVQIAIAAVTVFAAVAIGLTQMDGEDGTFTYYSSVGDFVGDGAPESSAGVARVHGFVVAGSIQADLPAGHVDFSIKDAENPGLLSVRFLGIDVPDLFRDGAEVVIEGRFERGTFLAERVMAKCPSKYENQEPGTEA